MRVLMIGPGKEVVGGITTLVEVLVPELKKYVTLFYFTSVERRPVNESGHFSSQNVMLSLSQYVRFIAMIFRSRPQIVHIHTSQGLGWLKDTFYIFVGKIYGSKVVLHVHAANFNHLYGSMNRFLKRYTRWTMNMTDAIISVSDEWRQRLGGIVSIERVFTFTNCIDIDSFPPKKASDYANGVKALFIGSIGSRKGAFDLLEALGRLKLKDCVLPTTIAGNEASEGEMAKARSRLQELNLVSSCELPGMVIGEKKARLFVNANILVLPSYNEGLPMAILEGMSAGMAIISTAVGGIPEIVHDGYNGFLVQPGDINALTEKLEVLVCNPTLCQLMGKRSREIVEELDVKSYVNRLKALYDSL